MVKSKKKHFSYYITLAIIAGFIIGLTLNLTHSQDLATYIKPFGVIFLRLLKMIIIPLIFSSVYMSVINLESVKNLASLGKYTLGYYFVTTSMAILSGIILVSFLGPGKGANLDISQKHTSSISESKENQKEKKPQELLSTVIQVFETAVPQNPIKAMVDGNIIQVIVFSLLLALVSLSSKEDAVGMISFTRSLEKISHHLTHAIMKVAPIGVFALIVNVVSSTGMNSLIYLGKYTLVVLLGLILHVTLLSVFISPKIKMSPLMFFKNISAVMLTAFSTSSSSATLPVTMSTLTEDFEVSEKTANFVLPLGATVNMDGTAIYVSISTIFIAQVYGIDLSISQLFLIFVTGSLAAIGTASVPGAGFITMGIVMGAVGVPLEGIQIVLAVERVLDMSRTVVNVVGDSVGAIFVDSLMKKRS